MGAASAAGRSMPVTKSSGRSSGRALSWPEAAVPEQRYLRRLLADVAAAIKARRTLAETLASVPGEGGQWLLFDQFHRRNVTAAYAELEWDD